MCAGSRTRSRCTAPTPSDGSGAERVVLAAADEGAALPAPADLLLLVGAAAGHVGGRVAEQGGAHGSVAYGELGDVLVLLGGDERGHHARGGALLLAAGEDVD